MSLKHFLQFLDNQNKHTITHFVIGNPSVDYDTFFGSIILSYILTSTTGHIHMPMIDCPRQELKLRFDIWATLEKTKINPNNLRFRQSSDEEYPKGTFTLYDHNERDSLELLTYIIDHHAYSSKDIHTNNFLIQKMGSALTLLYYLFQPHKINEIDTKLTEGSSFPFDLNAFIEGTPFEKVGSKVELDSVVKEIIRNGILIDSFNFDEKQKNRWTIFDKKAVEFLQKQQEFDSTYEWLEFLKYDAARNIQLTFQQQLIKDRKIFTYAGSIKCIYSVVCLATQDFYKHYRVPMEQFDAFHQNCDVYFVLSLFLNEKRLERQLMFRVNHFHQNSIESALLTYITSLKLTRLENLGGWMRWSDPNNTFSRKIFEPGVRETLQKLNN